MSTSKITIIGIERFLNNSKNISILNDLTLPAGIDKSILLDAIMLHGAEFELLYPEPDYLLYSIGAWGKKWYRTFEKWITALNIDYDPLYNYDRREEWTTTDDGSSSGERKLTGTTSGNSTDSGSGTSTDQVSAYNANTFQNDRQNSSTSTGTTTTSGNNSENETDSRTDKNTNIRTGRAYGNIGVTTSQQMLISELELAEWNLYEHIADIFISEFAIPVY